VIQGNKSFDAKLIKSTCDHTKINSNIAANRYLKRIKSNAYYRTATLRSIHQTFLPSGFKKPSFSWYCKTIKKAIMFKKPHRFSDLCHYCELYRVNIFAYFFIIILK
jgi:hypothetical protein